MISNLEHLGKLPIQTGAVWLQKSYFEHRYQTHPLPLNQPSLAQILIWTYLTLCQCYDLYLEGC